MSSENLLGGKKGDFHENSSLAYSEIQLVKKASRAFAVCYLNQMYKTIKVMDPALINKLKITKQYPFNLHLFIYQNKPGTIDRLEILSEKKRDADGFCEVKNIYHSAEFERSRMVEIKKSLSGKCMKRKWPSLDINNMYRIAIVEGKRAGKSICEHSSCSFGSPKTFVHNKGIPSSSESSVGLGTHV